MKAELRGLWDDGSAPRERNTPTPENLGGGAEKEVRETSLAEYLTATGQVRDADSPLVVEQYSVIGRGGDAGELQEIADIAHLLRTEREIADYAKSSAGDFEEARREVEAQREAVSALQRELQSRHIEIEARVRDVTDREKQLKKSEDHNLTLLVKTKEQEDIKTKEGEAASHQLLALQGKVSQREARIDARELELGEREQKIKSLQHTLDSEQQQSRALAQRVAEQERDMVSWKRQLDERQQAAEEAQETARELSHAAEKAQRTQQDDAHNLAQHAAAQEEELKEKKQALAREELERERRREVEQEQRGVWKVQESSLEHNMVGTHTYIYIYVYV